MMLKKRFDIIDLFCLAIVVVGSTGFGLSIYVKHKAAHPELNYGWHSCDELVEKKFISIGLVMIKFDDGCLAKWSKVLGANWLTYNHPVDIVDGDVVYLPNPAAE